MTFSVLVVSLALAAAAIQQEPAGRGRGRGSPPQPQQKQGVEYLQGTWTFTWTGRESPVTPGPREGTVTFERRGATTLEIRAEGKVGDTGEAFTERGGAEWDEARKVLVLEEALANGTSLTGRGDWSSPLSMRYESDPTQAEGRTVRIRRTYLILSAQSFSVAEEISIDGGPFQRLGNGLFSKSP